MRLADTQRLILGSPGTGKTTRLLSIVEEELQKVDPHRIAYVSFTKQAVQEATDRAKNKFNYTETDLPYFRTLHSICFQLLGLKSKDVMQKPDYDALGRELGYQFGKNDSEMMEEGYSQGSEMGDRLLFILGLARNRCVEVATQWHDINDPEIDIFELRRLHHALKDYKEQHGKVDFIDMLEELVVTKRHINVDVVIIDEAQDLSTLQWEVARVLFKNAKRIYIGGDDDQSCYSWAGADVNTFLALEGEQDILGVSYRLPQEIFNLANRTINGVKHRFPKQWRPREEKGSVTRHVDIDTVDMSADGTWLVLARNGYRLAELEDMLRRRGAVYTRKDKSSVKHEDYLAILWWERLRKGQSIPGDMVRQVYSKLQPGVGVERGVKAMLDFNPDKLYTENELREKGGLLAQGMWHDALTGIGLGTREYYISVLRSGQKLSTPPKIKLSTIHASKGGEADNVILLSDMSYRTFMNYQTDPDSETRVFYIGMTRARHNLHIIEAADQRGFPI